MIASLKHLTGYRIIEPVSASRRVAFKRPSGSLRLQAKLKEKRPEWATPCGVCDELYDEL
jgi:hypothetical protein